MTEITNGTGAQDSDGDAGNRRVVDLDRGGAAAAYGSASTLTYRLRAEVEAARTLLATMADVIGDDAELAADTVEGETNLQEVMRSAIARIIALNAMSDGIKATQEALAARKSRLEKQCEMIRESLAVALEVACVKKLETPLATISLRAVPPRAEIIDESAVPGKFWKPQEPRLDRKAVLDALKSKEPVPGATLSNGGMAISIRMA